MHIIARPSSFVRFKESCFLAAIAATSYQQAAAITTPPDSAQAIANTEWVSRSPLSSTTSPAVVDAGVSTLTITGTPAKSVAADQTYAFQPTAKAPAGKTITFSIANKPAWASFNTATGALRGTPSPATVGTYPNIEIKASDGAATVALPSFLISVTQIGLKEATLSWTPPTENANGTALTNLAGYRISYGTIKTDLSHTVTISSVGITRYVVSNLSSGTYYFAITAYNTAGAQSKESNIVSAKL